MKNFAQDLPKQKKNLNLKFLESFFELKVFEQISGILTAFISPLVMEAD
jgi:hypothetical protein